ncbi:GNAT family N-acetyltransferase, partial [Escherichia coli]
MSLGAFIMLEKFNQYRQTWTLPLNRHKANNQT